MKLKGFHNPLRPGEAEEIKALAAQGHSQKIISEMVGRSVSTVCNVINGVAVPTMTKREATYFDVDHYCKSVTTI